MLPWCCRRHSLFASRWEVCATAMSAVLHILVCGGMLAAFTDAGKWQPPLLLWGGHFQWHASLNKTTGLASSRERSTIPTTSPLYHQLVNRTSDDSEMLQLTQSIVQQYPTWLCRVPITFGLIRAVPVREGGVEIRTRVGGLNLLTFGSPNGQRLTYRENQEETCHCTVLLPIVGGLLALTPPKRSSNKSNSKNTRGALLVSLKRSQSCLSPGGSNDEELWGDYRCSLSSAIAGYRPSIVGHPPIPSWRRWSYFGSQSIVHACIMWRFHRYLWTNGADVARSARSPIDRRSR